jgi:hypothetical protein
MPLRTDLRVKTSTDRLPTFKEVLPPLNLNGFLPDGIHDSSLAELELRFATTPIRKIAWQRLLTFLRDGIESAEFSHIYLGGGFISSNESPADTDLILQTRSAFGPAAFKAMEPFFARGLDNIYRNHGIHLHFWCEGSPAEIEDFRYFFQNIRPGTTPPLEDPSEPKRGIVRVAVE